VTLLNVSKFVLILQEALAAIFAHCDGNVRHHCFVEFAW
jgi:hypothetical protein